MHVIEACLKLTGCKCIKCFIILHVHDSFFGHCIIISCKAHSIVMFFKRRKVCKFIRKILYSRQLNSSSVSRSRIKRWLCICVVLLTLIMCFCFLHRFIPWYKKLIRDRIPYLNDPCEESDKRLEELRTGTVMGCLELLCCIWIHIIMTYTCRFQSQI